MQKATVLLTISLALCSCADTKYVEKDSVPTATLVAVQAGKTNVLTFDNITAQRSMILRIDEPTKSIKIPSGEPFKVMLAWDLGTRPTMVGGANGITFLGCTPTYKFIPETGYTYTLRPGNRQTCELILVDQNGNAPPQIQESHALNNAGG